MKNNENQKILMWEESNIYYCRGIILSVFHQKIRKSPINELRIQQTDLDENTRIKTKQEKRKIQVKSKNNKMENEYTIVKTNKPRLINRKLSSLLKEIKSYQSQRYYEISNIRSERKT